MESRGTCSGLRAPAGFLSDPSAVDMDLLDAQTLAEALRWYLQELPTPLIPPAICTDLLHMAQGKHGRGLPVLRGVEEFWEAPERKNPSCCACRPLGEGHGDSSG